MLYYYICIYWFFWVTGGLFVQQRFAYWTNCAVLWSSTRKAICSYIWCRLKPLTSPNRIKGIVFAKKSHWKSFVGFVIWDRFNLRSKWLEYVWKPSIIFSCSDFELQIWLKANSQREKFRDTFCMSVVYLKYFLDPPLLLPRMQSPRGEWSRFILRGSPFT